MRFLLDQGLSPRVGDLLADADHDAVHARELGLSTAPDPIILRAALDDARVLVTLDTDFGTLLAHSGDAYRVHECVFGVLAMESEPVDPRL